MPGLFYLATAAPTVYGLDSAELTTGAYTLGIVHAPGSPTYMLIGHLFTWLPIGDVGYRMNLLSVVSAAATLVFVYKIHRILGASIALAVVSAWLLGFSYYFWITAVAAELYAPQSLTAALLLWLALRYREQPSQRRMAGWAFAFGVSLGVHLSTILLAPGMAVLLLSGAPRWWRKPANLGVTAAAALLGCAVYLYLPLRADAPLSFARNFGVDLRTLEGFWWMVSGRMFANHFLAVSPARWHIEAALYAEHLWSNFLGLGVVLGAAGFAADCSRHRAVHLCLALMLGSHLCFVLTYGVSDKALMLAPTYLLWSLWIPLGARAVTPLLANYARGGSGAATTVIASLALAALVINFRYADISDDWSARQRGESLLAQLPLQAVYIGTWQEVPVIEYLQVVEGQRRDVEAVNLFFVPTRDHPRLVAEHDAAGRPIYVAARVTLQVPDLRTLQDPICDCSQVIGPGRQIVPQSPAAPLMLDVGRKSR